MSVPAGSSWKISYSKAAKTFADPVEIDTTVLGKALFRDDLDVFLVNSKTSASTPFLISGSTDEENNLNIINNTGYDLHIQATAHADGSSASGAIKTIAKNNHLRVSSVGSELKNEDTASVPFVGIRDGSVSLSEDAYKNEVVLFNSDSIYLIDMVRRASSETNFFATTFVPFINDTKFNRYYPTRTSGYSGGFTLRNSQGDEESVSSLTPVNMNATGKASSLIDISCHLFEFILKNTNGKALYPNKDYDYIFTDSAVFSCILYNGLGDGTAFFQLNSDGNVKEELTTNKYETLDSVEEKAVLSISQAGASSTVSVTKGQVYFEQKLKNSLLGNDIFYPRFYLNKPFYEGKTIIFKDHFDIMCSFKSGEDYYFDKADTVTLVNISKSSCLAKTTDSFYPQYYHVPGQEEPSKIVRPKYSLTPSSKLYVLRHLADVEQAFMNGLKIANLSRGTIDLTYLPGDLDLKWKIFSSERADFQLTEFAKDIYKDKKGNEITKNVPPVEWLDTDKNKHKIYTKYSEIRKQDKRDWFVRLVDLDIPHLIKDPNYFNEQEWEMERKIEKLGQVNVDYNGVRFKFSNIFRTNKQEAVDGETGFQSIEDYDDAYKFGITLLANRRGVNKKIFFDKDISGQASPVYLKLPWNMPKDIVAYMLSTGHERLSRCLHFNERNGEITLDGINSAKKSDGSWRNKYYSLESEDASSYDFTHSVEPISGGGFNNKSYIGIEQNKEFKPSLIYNNIIYYAGQKIVGAGGISEYKLSFPYFSTLMVSQFFADSVNESAISRGEGSEFFSDKKALQAEADKQTFNWDKVSKPLHEDDFLSGRVESITSYHASDKHELIFGRKIKDIDGSYIEDINDLEKPDYRSLWNINNWFRFKIPLNAGYSYTKAPKGNEKITIKDEAGKKKKEGEASFTAAEGDIAEIDVYFIVSPNIPKVEDDSLDLTWALTNIESPGFEYKISSSLKYNRSSIPSTKKVMQISLETKDSIPFIADGNISSLNEDFSTPDLDEYTTKALDRLNAQYENNTNDEKYINAYNTITALSNNQIHQSLKNNLGHSFVPAFGVTSEADPMVGFTFNLKKDLRSYEAIRFRLKKLTDKTIVFDDFAKDEKLKDYFANNSDEANLRYNLNTSIGSIAYQDIAHPGGVATMPHSEWEKVVLSGSGTSLLLTLPKFDDCDAIVFKESNGEIIAGKPYFLRITELDYADGTFDYDVLKIFSNDTDYDPQLKINSSLVAGQKYKIVNYFDLLARGDETGHRAETPLINKLYPEGLGSEEDPGLAKYPSLNFPIIVGSKKFFLERPYYQNADDSAEIALWPDTVWKEEKGVFKVRANLELSEISQAFVSDGDEIPEMERFSNGSNTTLWQDEEIFSSVKNLLSRPNISKQLVSWDKKTKIALINIKLTKGKGYRCFYQRERDKTEHGLSGLIHSITINDGTAKTISFCDIFTATSEDFFVEVNLSSVLGDNHGDFDVHRQFGLFSQTDIGEEEGRRDLILNSISGYVFLIESATFVDQTVKTGDDNSDDPVGNLEAAEYLDYQIPILNNGNDRDFNFTNADDFYYTEGHDKIFTRNQRQESLTDKSNPQTGGLMYDGPMPADIKYIYPRCQVEGSDTLSFYISNDYWNGFIDRFEAEDQYGSKSNRTKPLYINSTLEKLEQDGVTWTAITTSDKFLTARRAGKAAYANITYIGAKVNETYRLVINSEKVRYHKDGKEEHFSNSNMRVPFEWQSTIFSSDVISTENTSREVFEHKLSLINNHLLQKSIAFPENGISKFGSYDYKRKHYDLGLKVPFSRLYMYRLNHSLSCTYVDRVTQGGITKIEVSDAGANYRLPPIVSVSVPTLGLANQRTATANAHIESGKIKYVNILDSGSGYSDLNDLKTTKFISSSRGKGSYITREWVIQESDVERELDFIDPSEQFGVEAIPVSTTPVYPEGFAENHPLYVDDCQEDFGIDFQESEDLAEYVDTSEGADLAKDAVSATSNYVKALLGVVEDPNWDKVADKDRVLGEKSKVDNSSIIESSEISAYGATTKDEYVDSSQGTENPDIAGLYEPDSRDSSSEITITVEDDGRCITETFPSIDPASLTAIVNNHSLAEYRVVQNQIANKATPWITSFTRDQNPSMPKGFGINPGSPVSSEVFNAYARAVNNLSLIGAYVPVFAKVRKFRQYEYRHISDMAGLTFREGKILGQHYDAGSASGGIGGVDFMAAGNVSFQHKSKINKIEYFDPTEYKWKDAWFSAGFGAERENGNNIYDTSERIDLLDNKEHQEGFINKTKNFARGSDFTPNDIGLPTIVNIPEEAGVFCNPEYYGDSGSRLVGPGVELPELLNRRAIAFGGELVHTSEIYDVTDEDSRILSSIVNIAGSEIIDSFYENEIIFGCQTKGKTFWSTFLKTTKEWTEFEIVPSPSFIEAISAEETLGNLTGIKGTVTRTTTLCSNEEFDKVQSRFGDDKHSVCEGGTSNSKHIEYSYEDLFNLREGDPVVGPVEKDHEIVFEQAFGGEGTQIFKLEPEFTQALAVYGSNKYIHLTRSMIKSYYRAGPCIHKCSPSARAIFKASDEQLVFDLKSGSKKKTLDQNIVMPNLTNVYNSLVDPETGAISQDLSGG